MYSHTYVLRAKTHKNLIIWKIFCLNSSQSRICGNKFFDCWQNLYMNFSVWNLYFFKRNKKLHNLFYYNLTMIKSGESWDGDKSTVRFLLCSSGFMKPPSGMRRGDCYCARLHPKRILMCMRVLQITIKCLTYLIHYPSKCNPQLLVN